MVLWPISSFIIKAACQFYGLFYSKLFAAARYTVFCHRFFIFSWQFLNQFWSHRSLIKWKSYQFANPNYSLATFALLLFSQSQFYLDFYLLSSHGPSTLFWSHLSTSRSERGCRWIVSIGDLHPGHSNLFRQCHLLDVTISVSFLACFTLVPAFRCY